MDLSFNTELFMQFYNINVKKYVIYCIVDNTSTNHKIARIFKKNHIECSNNLLNLDEKRWIDRDHNLNTLVCYVGIVMKKS